VTAHLSSPSKIKFIPQLSVIVGKIGKNSRQTCHQIIDEVTAWTLPMLAGDGWWGLDSWMRLHPAKH
jgi:hypothetical protein